DEKRNDFQDDAEPFFGAFDEFFIHLHAMRGGVNRKEAEKKWNGEERERVHAPHESALGRRVRVGREIKQRWENHPHEKRDEEEREDKGEKAEPATRFGRNDVGGDFSGWLDRVSPFQISFWFPINDVA